ncbi:MAG: hypothetical protein FWF08_04650, partial [Oscillospiraceae bacterium]|nr:hypothetical protein [Oscillospiraceae bacterium]
MNLAGVTPSLIMRFLNAVPQIVTMFKRVIATILAGLGLLTFSAPPFSVTEKMFMPGDEAFITEAVSDYWTVGFAKRVTTPLDILENPEKYYLAGYSNDAHPIEVMDDTFVRTVYIDDNSGRGGVLFSVIDGVGLSNKEVLEIRAAAADFTAANGIKSVNVSCTHAHCAVDIQGLWGPDSFTTGRSDEYNGYVKTLAVESMKEAFENRQDGKLYLGDITPDFDVFRDSRRPEVFEKTITRLRFEPFARNSDADDLYIACLSAHPECMAFQNVTLSADFPAYMGRYIAETTGGADFIFFNGAVGCLINGNGIDDIFKIISDELLLPKTPEGSDLSNFDKARAKMFNIMGEDTGALLLNTLDDLTTGDFDENDRLSAEKKTELRKNYTKSYGFTIGRYIMAVNNEQEINPILNIRFNPIMVPVENVLLELSVALKL